MRYLHNRLYCMVAPLMLGVLPMMDLTVSEIWEYARGPEFRQFLGEVIIQAATGAADAIILVIIGTLFGTI